MDHSSSALDAWLVRTSKNVVVGPYTIHEVKAMIQEGKLGLQDEVCQANQYWFYLNEAHEVKKFLGIDLQMNAAADPDMNETDFTETSTEIMIEGSAVSKSTSSVSLQEAEVEGGEETDDVPELDQSPDELEADSGILKNRALREFRPRRKKLGGKVPPASDAPVVSSPLVRSGTPDPEHFRVEVTGGRVERPFFWRGVALFLLVVFCFLVAAVIFIIKKR